MIIRTSAVQVNDKHCLYGTLLTSEPADLCRQPVKLLSFNFVLICIAGFLMFVLITF